MFRSGSDAQQEDLSPSAKNIEENIDNININVICEIEKELQDSSQDIISLVFLLYDVPDTALQRLLVYQRVAGDVTATNLNLLQDWAQRAKSKSSWKHEFLEGLLICQLYGIVVKLGFHLPSTKKHYQPDNLHISMHINPMKKALYKVCENIGSNNLARLKSTLQNCKVNTMEFESCELIFLKLMSEKFIAMTQVQYDKKVLGCKFNMDKLVNILEKLPGLDNLAKELRLLQTRTSDEPAPAAALLASPPSMPPSDFSKPLDNPMTFNDFTDIYEMMEDLKIEDHLKSDTKNMSRDKYAIKNSNSLGVCLIINQEDFCLSEKSIADRTLTTILGKRYGSTADKRALEATLSSLNFDVVIGENLDHEAMIDFIKDNIRDKVKNSDSIFMLCIMSHGVRGHVYAADCVKVNVEGIQGILDSEEASVLRGMPKVMIIQACRVDDSPQSTLVADSPYDKKKTNYYLMKSDFLIYWATAPQYEAYRDESRGSIFIQYLCKAIQKLGKREHLYDIFTKVNNCVQELCMKKKCQQVPIFESTLSKKLYLQNPE